MDGGAGPCSLDLTVTGPDAKPAYAAIVKVHIVYGFAGIRRLDLEAGTNSDGKVKFTGLPGSVHRPPLEFDVAKDELQGKAIYDPATECQATRDVTLRKAPPSTNNRRLDQLPPRLRRPFSGLRQRTERTPGLIAWNVEICFAA